MYNLFSKNISIPKPEDCLVGRTEPIILNGTHYVTGKSLIPPYPENTEQIIMGMGCFWGAERIFWDIPGVYTTLVGYSGGTTPNPNYEEVCSGMTGHNEVVKVIFFPDLCDLETLLVQFWENHDPTQFMRQGNDIGSQYRSAIYTTINSQIKIVSDSLEHYQNRLDISGFNIIKTEISEAKNFYFAEEYHQQYLAKIPNGYCNHGFCQATYNDK